MKILSLLFLLVLVSCGSGGGGGSSASGVPAGDNGGNSAIILPVATYHLIVEGCNGSSFTAIAYADPNTVDEVRHDWNGSIGASGTTNISISARHVNWEVHSISGGCALTMKLYRDHNGSNDLAAQKTINSNGDIETINY